MNNVTLMFVMLLSDLQLCTNISKIQIGKSVEMIKSEPENQFFAQCLHVRQISHYETWCKSMFKMTRRKITLFMFIATMK